ncbi:hypothetical protein BBEV_0844 [Salisediminibacterium beveridgei]|uniref:Uncharacterized protein n=2 Tax=Salisediminibacterium beveridgei TaxID=632773 RepID=A0A1D7QTA9_9BACI|nr:hypothetical protein BBEV_0844 [Salisediminibacterium beveridgei]
MVIALSDPDLLFHRVVSTYVIASVSAAFVLQTIRHKDHYQKLGAPQQNPYSGSAAEEYTQHEVIRDQTEEKRHAESEECRDH